MYRVERLIRLVKIALRGRPRYCPVCKTRLWRFRAIPLWYLKHLDKYGFIHSVFALETLNLFASSCPSCGASDRDRLCALYLEHRFKLLDATNRYKFVDFAPSASLSRTIKACTILEYRSADLFDSSADDKVDIQDMQIYSEASIDIFLCSHVLEHVPSDRTAIAELYRILRPGGWGIVMVPIQLTLTDVYEDPSITSEADRWKHFGQGDHLRLYSKQGFVSRLAEAGFEVNQFGIDHFGADVFETYGISARSVLYVVEKALSSTSAESC